MTPRRLFFVVTAAAVLVAGCGKKEEPKKEITSLQRKQAETLVHEADFAVTIRDLPRAEGLLAQAAELVPDTGELWLRLGYTRMRMARKEEARTAYRNALSAFQDAARERKDDPEPLLQQVTTLALLGETEEARKLAEKIGKQFPEHREVAAFIAQKSLERMLADPQFKQLAL